jgi:hypothetical protein
MVAHARCNCLAFCEGDDYCTDEYKLLKQIFLIERHSNCNAVFHNVVI